MGIHVLPLLNEVARLYHILIEINYFYYKVWLFIFFSFIKLFY